MDSEFFHFRRSQGAHHRDPRRWSTRPARIAVLAGARQATRDISQTCGPSASRRTRYYKWKNQANLSGLEALMPKEASISPDALGHPDPAWSTPCLTLAVLEPTHRLSPVRRSAEQQGACDRQVDHTKSTSSTIKLNQGQAPGPGHGRPRQPRRGSLAGGGPDDEPFGSASAAGGPGQAGLHRQLLHRPAQGRGARSRSSTPSTSSPAGPSSGSSWAPPMRPSRCASWTACCATTAATASRSLHMLSDNRPGVRRLGLQRRCGGQGITHVRVPPRSPNHNAMVERPVRQSASCRSIDAEGV